MSIKEIYMQAGLSESEIKDMPSYISDDLDFYWLTVGWYAPL